MFFMWRIDQVQIDHIKPLYEQKYKQPHEVDHLIDEKNLQTLCRKCHKEKQKRHGKFKRI